MAQTWRKLQWATECLNCGSDDVEVLTSLTEPNMAYDGDTCRCAECSCPGIVSADEDDAHISWHDEPDCDCDWCKSHPTPRSTQ